MDSMMNVWTVVEHVRVASGAAELAIFTAILYWFFTSSRVADMLEVVGERVGGWCGRDSTTLRRPVLPRRRYQNDVYAKLDAEISARNTALFRMKDGPVVPPPRPQTRPPQGLACARCAPLSRESWQDPKSANTGAVINILDIGRQTFANGGVVSRYLCDLAQCCHLIKYDYKDVVPSVVKDERFQAAIEQTAQEELKKTLNGVAPGQETGASQYTIIRKKVEAKAMKVLKDISSAMSNHVLRLVAWLCHKAIRRVASGGCGTRAECVERLRRAKAAGLPLVFVPLHRSHFDYILVTFTLYLTGLRPPLVAAGDNMRIPFFGWFLRGCGAFYIRRRVDGSEYHGDPIYKSALRAYILNSLAANNNLEFFIEGGRTRTGKPQPPKAGILSVIMDAYLDGTIDDALLVPVTLNYDKLVDGNFVREQLGMPKQMETFWSAMRGIWRTLNTDHGAIRVDFNQPISLKELVTSFQKYKYLKAPIEHGLSDGNSEHQIVSSNSHSSLYGDGVSDDHKLMVDSIGRHLVYDAAQATALMCTNVVAYVLLTEQRGGCGVQQLAESMQARGRALRNEGRDLGYSGTPLLHALDMLGRGLVRRTGNKTTGFVKPHLSVAASLELSYYANSLVAHYAKPAIVATALESIVQEASEDQQSEDQEIIVDHEQLLQRSLQLASVLSQEFLLCPPCTRLEDLLLDTIGSLVSADILIPHQKHYALEEQRWSQRVARQLEEDDEPRVTPTKYRVSTTPEALAERRRLLLTIRPLLEAYSALCRRVRSAPHADLVADALAALTDDFAHARMPYGEAVSTDAIKNCVKLLRAWGAVTVHTEGRRRSVCLAPPYDCPERLQQLCARVYRYTVRSPLLDCRP